jgi:hypothetical protein
MTDVSVPMTLRGIVIAATGHDVRRCGRCSYCVKHAQPDHDVSLETLLHMVMLNDEEVLTSRTLWSDDVLRQARRMCISTLDMPAIMLALRAEARRRGLVEG